MLSFPPWESRWQTAAIETRQYFEIDSGGIEFAGSLANRDALMLLMTALRDEEATIRAGGGAKAAEAQRAKGRLTVRERLGVAAGMKAPS